MQNFKGMKLLLSNLRSVRLSTDILSAQCKRKKCQHCYTFPEQHKLLNCFSLVTLQHQPPQLCLKRLVSIATCMQTAAPFAHVELPPSILFLKTHSYCSTSSRSFSREFELICQGILTISGIMGQYPDFSLRHFCIFQCRGENE